MRSRLPLKKVGPEDWGLRLKASQVYARRGLAGTGKPTTRFERLEVPYRTLRAASVTSRRRLRRSASRRLSLPQRAPIPCSRATRSPESPPTSA